MPQNGHPTLDAMLERCAKLGLTACNLSADGTMIEVRAPHALWAEMIETASFRKAMQRVAMMEASKRLRGGYAPAKVCEGVWAVVCPFADDAGLRGSTVAILVSETATKSELLAKAVVEAGMEASELAPLIRTTATYDLSTATLLARTLSGICQDVATMQRSNGELEGFTKQLTGAFETIDVLYNLGRSMKAVLSPADFLQQLCARTATSLQFGWVVALFDNAAKTPSGLLNMFVHHGELPTSEQEVRGAASEAMHDNDTTCKIHNDLLQLVRGGNTQVITQPLLCKGHQIGVLMAGAKGGEDPMISSYDTQLFEACAGFLSTFIDNVALYDDQHQLFLGTLRALTAAIDAKDRYTCGHSERVALVSMQLAQLAGLPANQCERIRIAGLVHDVGKIGVPEHVLLKNGKLTDEEFAHIKKHPETGNVILQGVPMLDDVLPGVMHHHERYDGKGYPHGLFGTEIPLMARIIAVADTFDAMSSNRAYRSKLPREVVLAEIAKSGGTQLDPRLSQLMLKLDLTAYDEMSKRHASMDQQTADERAASKAA